MRDFSASHCTKLLVNVTAYIFALILQSLVLEIAQFEKSPTCVKIAVAFKIS